jgi:ABC-2 type transport system permease protein
VSSGTLPDDALRLTDVRGPSALGGGARRSMELLWLIAVTEFKRTYFGTVLGYLWSLCRPLLLFAVLLVVFTHVLRLGDSVPHYPVFLLLNIVLFGFFQEATNTAVGSVLAQEAVVRKTQFPRLVIPLAVVLTSVFNLVLNLVVVLVFVLGFGISPTWTWLLFPLILLALFVLTIAVAMILSALYPRFRDLAIIWAVFSTALLYASPVLYPIQRAGGTLQHLLAFNPLAPLFELTRRWVIQPGAPVQTGVLDIAVPAAIFLGVCVLAVWVFRREAPRIAEAL